MEFAKVVFWIDKEDVIVRVNDFWDQFALENDAPELTRNSVVGRPLRHFVSGNTTQMFVNTMLQSVRFKGKLLNQPYRCDSPTHRRYMKMTLLPEDDGLIRFENELVRIETIQQPISFYLDHRGVSGLTTRKIILRCSVCNRIQIKDEWTEGERAVAEGLIIGSTVPVAYSVCPVCKSNLDKALQQQRELLQKSTRFLID